MKETTLVLYMVPRRFWEERDDAPLNMAPFVEDALVIERRIGKGVNLANERMRYALCCRRIQDAVFRTGDSTEKAVLGQGYYDILHGIFARFPAATTQSRVLACFFPPEHVLAHLDRFKALTERGGFSGQKDVRKRAAFFEKASAQGAGVVEVSDFLVGGKDHVTAEVVPCPAPKAAKPMPGRYKGQDQLSEETRQDMLQALKSQIGKAAKTGGEVNFSNQPHFVIADALNAFVYKDDSGQSEDMIRVVYMDGSEASPFPLRCLVRSPEETRQSASGLPILRAALISMRHLAMDEQVDFCWFRNRKVSVPHPFAEIDAYCTDHTMELLKAIPDHGLQIDLYQTGLETAVVGFYRGLVLALKERRMDPHAAPLRVVPRYYGGTGGEYGQGETWE